MEKWKKLEIKKPSFICLKKNQTRMLYGVDADILY